MTGLMIMLGLFGKPAIAAEFGIVQGATMAVFYAFSANARSLILNAASKIEIKDILSIRLTLLLPLSALSFFLSVGLMDISWLLVVILIARRSTEWVSEIYLSQLELNQESRLAFRFVIVQTLSLLLAITLALASDTYFLIGMFVWAVLPLFLITGMVKRTMVGGFKPVHQLTFGMLPHFGSTVITGVSVYIFRLLIYLLVGKTIAGDLYTAFAIGSLLGSVFVNALGPSLAYKEKVIGTIALPRWLKTILASILFAGLALFLAAEMNVSVLSVFNKSSFFWSAVGLSLIGGPIMLLAQRFRISMLQLHGDRDVMGPDLVSNLVIISFLPFAFYLFGINILKTLYLFNAVIAIIIYWSATQTNLLKTGIVENRKNNKRLLYAITIILLFPLFFQLSGSIFHDSSLVYDTMGKLLRLPIPISVFACIFGLIIIGKYEGTGIGLFLLFSTFVIMIFTTILSTKGALAFQRDKFILLIQFILPIFSMFVGQMFGLLQKNRTIFQKGAMVVLFSIVPVQLVSTVLKGTEVLSPNILFFSIYQHLQYVPTVFVCLFLFSFYSFWGDKKGAIYFFILAPFMAVYVILSSSMAALITLYIGLILTNTIGQFRANPKRFFALLSCMVIFSIGCLIPLKVDEKFLKKNDISLNIQLPKSIQIPKRVKVHNKVVAYDRSHLNDRTDIWKWYVRNIISNPKTILIGNAAKPDREKYPSAHNYYIDIVHNFGLPSLIPIMVVLFYTTNKIFTIRTSFFKDPILVGLVLVLFILLSENMFKVGLRQPYPGIITFFLWGLLLSNLCSKRFLHKRYQN